jgi:hypothetical protein
MFRNTLPLRWQTPASYSASTRSGIKKVGSQLSTIYGRIINAHETHYIEAQSVRLDARIVPARNWQHLTNSACAWCT